MRRYDMSLPDGIHFVLDGHRTRPATSWDEMFRPAPDTFRVARTVVGAVTVSTMFLTSNRQWGHGPPLLFETMIFGGELDESQELYATWDEAAAGHARWVQAVRAREDNR